MVFAIGGLGQCGQDGTPVKPRCVVVLSILILVLVCCILFLHHAHGEELLRRPFAFRPVETCQEHVALTRHWLKDAAEVSPVDWHRKWLRQEYRRSLQSRYIAMACADKEARAEYDLDLSDLRLQMAYDILRNEELAALKRAGHASKEVR